MTTLFIRHAVSDYPAWKKIFDEVEPMRRKSGMVRDAVYQSANDPNDVTVANEFASMEQARAFVQSPDLARAMGRAGVVGEPTMWFGEKSGGLEF